MTKLEEMLVLGFTRQEVLAAMLGRPVAVTTPTSEHHMIGKWCIARCVGAGVHVGVVTAIDGDTVEFAPGSLRLWRWFAVGGTGALHGVAAFGLNHSCECRAEAAPGLQRLTGVCELIECADAAVATFKPVWK